VQRLWTVPQDERPEPTAHPAQEAIGTTRRDLSWATAIIQMKSSPKLLFIEVFPLNVFSDCQQAGGHAVRQLSHEHDDAVETQRRRRARVQRLRPLLQAAQREFIIPDSHFTFIFFSS